MRASIPSSAAAVLAAAEEEQAVMRERLQQLERLVAEKDAVASQLREEANSLQEASRKAYEEKIRDLHRKLVR